MKLPYTKKSIAVLIFLSIIFPAISEELKIGSNLQKENLLKFEDQFGEEKEISTETKYIIFAADMEGTKIAHELFDKKKGEFLTMKKAIFVGDIHKMPYVISKFIAIPKMRNYPYPILLIREEGKGSPFPREKGKLTGFVLDKLTVQSIKVLSNTEELESFLK
jgi:hypothetical protein